MENLMDESGSLTVRAAGRDWELCRPADLESLWEALAADTPPALPHGSKGAGGREPAFVKAFEEDERLPYWVELWPASIALSDWLHSNSARIRGKRCLDLGCGLGLTAMVASACGALVLAMDYEKDALDFARLNAELNGVPQPLWTVMDWRAPAVRRASLDFIWGGDIMYERRFVTPVLDFLDYALAPDGVVWLAEPNRNVYDDFRAELLRRKRPGGRGWNSGRVYSGKVEPLHVQKAKVSVSLWELS
ncbi:MAG: 50S ribosomal protein L11 methyltransferase [Deltaproteobacteria bacterium]|jgi:predicted nicotinamide N-methyase|nr:50S ribosomal protein L11 methyltransferase [Deltaproteobacteria bacterium]